ncbi:hypothetical protein [Amycolatopsis marina]|uniref:hypothetical protein n=1 Tax=Amycolatopsis marina TaxID=490629 RepID=UPI001160BBEE|nr:hypothetical protein [Amycolatopsis marina]
MKLLNPDDKVLSVNETHELYSSRTRVVIGRGRCTTPGEYCQVELVVHTTSPAPPGFPVLALATPLCAATESIPARTAAPRMLTDRPKEELLDIEPMISQPLSSD